MVKLGDPRPGSKYRATHGREPRMITAKADVLIFQKVEQVYQFVALNFVANYPRWSAEVVNLEAAFDQPAPDRLPGPAGARRSGP